MPLLSRNTSTPLQSDETPKAIWGSFAVVCYAGESVTSYLKELRRLIPSKELPEAHITVLPPRPLEVPIEVACRQIETALAPFGIFEVELSQVAQFPETSFLYLDIGRGSETLHAMHACLNRGELEFAEDFEFRPHLTLGGPVRPESGDEVRTRVEKAWKSLDCARRLSVREIVCLWLEPSCETIDWVRFKTCKLAADQAEATIPNVSGLTSQTY